MTESMDTLLQENRVFDPPHSFKNANVSNPSIYNQEDEPFWANEARKLDWFKPFEKVLSFTAPYAKWFEGGKLNAAYNCLDRHLAAKRNKAAFMWEGEDGKTRVLTYWELHREVCQLANVYKNLGLKKGDRIAIYMPLIPEAIVAMLASARIGLIHTVVFGGFSAESLKDRIEDSGAKLLITADGGYRRGAIIPLKSTADTALASLNIQNVIVVKRTGNEIDMQPNRDLWYHDLVPHASPDCPPEWMDSEDPLYILYTSGTTGKPKGILHTTAGYLTQCRTTCEMVFDMKDNDLYWCTADIGWVTGHSYVVYGPLAIGVSQVIYEGAPDWPKRNRFWKIIEKYGVTIFYTAPTAIRAFMKWGAEFPASANLSTLRLLGSVGEPINPEAWMWYHTHIGSSRCPIVDTWWQTETGAIMIAPIPALTPLKPGSATKPLPGIHAAIVDSDGKKSDAGYLLITKPWPAMLRGIWNDPKRFHDTYWSRFPNTYFTGDGARLDQDGYLWLMGRVDDVINVSGHRLGTMEVESALVDHPSVAEAAVVGVHDELKGQSITAFVILKENYTPSNTHEAELKAHVVQKIGSIARPERILFARDLPKTRSGKIMRRLLRDIAEGRLLGDITTLADSTVVEELKEKYKEE